jgi:adenosylhomocysteine nucleosidase
MTTKSQDWPCLLFALSGEARPFRRHFRPWKLQRLSACRLWQHNSSEFNVVLLETGIGSARVTAALEWLLTDGCPLIPRWPRFFLSAGYSGALREGLQVGDVILAKEFADQGGNIYPASWLPQRVTSTLSSGRLLTLDRLTGDPKEKHHLGQQFGAVAVDMESAAVAKVCASRGIPFGAVRVISDDVDTCLSPQLVSLLSGSRVSLLRVLGNVIRSPNLIPQLWRLARNTRLAARQLGQTLCDLLRSATTP